MDTSRQKLDKIFEAQQIVVDILNRQSLTLKDCDEDFWQLWDENPDKLYN